jgi:hypothetical protein
VTGRLPLQRYALAAAAPVYAAMATDADRADEP